MTARIIRCDGTEVRLDKSPTMAEIHALIGARTLDTVSLRHLGYPLQVMVLDDSGYETETIVHSDGHHELRPTRALKPDNPKATALYHANCKPGTTHQIVGDVVVCFDQDFD